MDDLRVCNVLCIAIATLSPFAELRVGRISSRPLAGCLEVLQWKPVAGVTDPAKVHFLDELGLVRVGAPVC